MPALTGVFRALWGHCRPRGGGFRCIPASRVGLWAAPHTWWEIWSHFKALSPRLTQLFCLTSQTATWLGTSVACTHSPGGGVLLTSVAVTNPSHSCLPMLAFILLWGTF